MKHKLLSFVVLLLAFLYSNDIKSQQALPGEIRLFPYEQIPAGWLECNGQSISKATYGSLFSVIGYTYGGDGATTFAVPDLRGRAAIQPGYGSFSVNLGDKYGTEFEIMTPLQMPMHIHNLITALPCFNGNASTNSPGYYAVNPARGNEFNTIPNSFSGSTQISSDVSGGSLPRNNLQPFLALVWCISTSPGSSFNGVFGEIRFIAGNTSPSTSWDFCEGKLLAINQNTDLFGAFGTTYGGNGTYNFALPDLRARVAIGKGQGASLSNYELGQTGGSPSISYYLNNLPPHSHRLDIKTSSKTADKDVPTDNFPAITNSPAYSLASNTNMALNSLMINAFPAGGSQPQNNVQPFLGINHIVAVQGIITPVTPYLGEIQLTASTATPGGWLPCEGQELQISDNEALFNLLGTTFGGDGSATFRLPDLRGRVPIGRSDALPLGLAGGTEKETIHTNIMTSHTHQCDIRLQVFSGVGNANTPENNFPAINPKRGYEFSLENSVLSDLYSVTTDFVGEGEPVDNMQPFLTLRYLICTNGIIPAEE